MIVTEIDEKQMWNVFAETGRVEDYIKYAQYMRKLSEKNSGEGSLMQTDKPQLTDRKENGSAVG